MFRNYSNYEVFEDGRIYSYKYKKFLKPATLPNGYQQVALTDNEGKQKTYYLHRVVYEAVTSSQIPDGLQVNHIDENKENNNINNLNLMTPKQNTNWGTGKERSHKAQTNGKRSKSVGAYRNGELVMVFPSTMECGRQGFNFGNVAACCRNCYIREGNNKYKGFTWKYI